MEPWPINAVARIVTTDEPVAIAPRGENYHIATPAGFGYRPVTPPCGTYADRWLVVDEDFARLLDRTPCNRCWPPKEDPE